MLATDSHFNTYRAVQKNPAWGTPGLYLLFSGAGSWEGLCLELPSSRPSSPGAVRTDCLLAAMIPAALEEQRPLFIARKYGTTSHLVTLKVPGAHLHQQTRCFLIFLEPEEDGQRARMSIELPAGAAFSAPQSSAALTCKLCAAF